MLISPAYRDLNRQLHSENALYGISGERFAKDIERLIESDKPATILDYGAGKGTLAQALPGLPIINYDPCVPGMDAAPEPADLVVCTDVLEHIEREHLNAVLRDLKRVTRRKLFFNISTVPALKKLPDGRNAHLIVQDAAWWRERLERHFHILWMEPKRSKVFGEAVPRLEPPQPFKRPARRRPVPPQLADMFDHVRKQASKYNDAFNQISTIRMWEGFEDAPADMQCVANLLEDWPNPDEALAEVCGYAHKAVMLAITLGDGRTPGDWRKILERRIRIAEWYELDQPRKQLLVVGSPCTSVQGVFAIGAVSADDRWVQVEAATRRFAKRIETAPAHKRRAIIVCYGPSLESTLELIRKERAGTGAVVVSVSGAHDFLLKHGIVPDYHVECDPRPHKADNIDRMQPGVTYMLASCVSPVLFEKLGPDADMRLWHVSTAEHTVKLIEQMGERTEHVISGGGSVGLRSIPLMYALGYRDISIYAMDCSFADNGDKQWAGRHFGKRQDLCQVKCGDRIFISSPTLLSYATNFWECVKKVQDLDVRLYGDGLLQAMARYYMSFEEGKAA